MKKKNRSLEVKDGMGCAFWTVVILTTLIIDIWACPNLIVWVCSMWGIIISYPKALATWVLARLFVYLLKGNK